MGGRQKKKKKTEIQGVSIKKVLEEIKNHLSTRNHIKRKNQKTSITQEKGGASWGGGKMKRLELW